MKRAVASLDYFGDCKHYIGFDSETAATLATLVPLLEPHFGDIADRFYVAITQSPGALKVIATEEMRLNLHRTLQDWMRSGLTGPHGDTYLQSRERIGQRHVQVGLAQHYMVTAINVVRAEYARHVFTLPSPARETALVAVDRLLDLDLLIMLHSYQTDVEARLVSSERKTQAERLLAMQTLSAGLAHEVRNPLNAAVLQLELLARRIRRSGEDPKLAEPTRLVHLELQRLSRMLTEFSSFARPPDLLTDWYDVAEIVARVVDAEQPMAAARAVTIKSDTQSARTRVDAGKLHQAIQNLLRNAIEASPPGAAVEVRLWVDSAATHFEVVDRGRGIPPDLLPRIYEPFYSTKEGGTGLGMSIVHSIVTQHRGVIDCESALGHTLFRVSLPVATEL